MEPKIEPLKLTEKDKETQEYLETLKQKMLGALGVPREYIEPALTAGSEMIYHRILNSYGPDPEEVKKLNITIESTES